MRIFNTMRADDTVHCMTVFIYLSLLKTITYDFLKKKILSITLNCLMNMLPNADTNI